MEKLFTPFSPVSPILECLTQSTCFQAVSTYGDEHFTAEPHWESKSVLTAKCHRAHKHTIHTMKIIGSTCLLAEKEELSGSLYHSSCPTSSIKYVGVLGLHLRNLVFVVRQEWELLTWTFSASLLWSERKSLLQKNALSLRNGSSSHFPNCKLGTSRRTFGLNAAYFWKNRRGSRAWSSGPPAAITDRVRKATQ